MPYQFRSQQYIRILYPELVIYITEHCGLCRSEHVFRHRQAIGWFSVPLLTQHCTLCDQYMCQCILLNPSIQFGHHHTHNTRCPVHFAVIARCKLALSKHHFWQKARIHCHSSFSVTYYFFHHNLYKCLKCMLWFYVCHFML